MKQLSVQVKLCALELERQRETNTLLELRRLELIHYFTFPLRLNRQLQHATVVALQATSSDFWLQRVTGVLLHHKVQCGLFSVTDNREPSCPSIHVTMDCEKLINLMHERKYLWDQKEPQSHMRNVTTQLWKEVSAEMKEPIADVKRKWKNLRFF